MLPKDVQQAISHQFKQSITHSQAVSGGDINQAAKVVLADGLLVFVKWHLHPPRGMFPAEAMGLELLAQAQALKIPQVYMRDEGYLVMECLETDGQNIAEAGVMLGQGLAQQHRFTCQLLRLKEPQLLRLEPST